VMGDCGLAFDSSMLGTGATKGMCSK